ncbi:tetratricopeptide repeat protein [Paracidobacterium acidisoli]|nr:tetratricopeptide repeat protein [Paracidobacterium acidisoli]MBT9331700.1 tetratricopeptide repeat protein [Paracidobacterium acidisoli]
MHETEALSLPLSDRFAPALREGLLHQADGRLPEAAECYRRAWIENREDADALLLLGILARQAGQPAASVRLTALAAERRPQAAHMHLNLALAHLAAGDMERAAVCCRGSLALDADNDRAWRVMGEIEAKRGHEEAAQAAYEHAMRRPAGVERAALALGHLLCRQGKYEESLAVYAEGIRRSPENADLYFALGAALVSTDRRREAKKAYREALRRRPDFPEVYLNLGNVLYDEGNFTGAARAYRRAVALRPQYGKAHCNLGNALSALGRYVEAVACYERAIELKPELAAAQHNLGNALLHRRDYPGAEVCFRQALAMEDGRAEHHNSLGNALMQQRRTDEARQCYSRAIELDPDYAAAHTNLANVLLKLGRRSEMEGHYRRGVELDPESAGAHYNLALSCLRAGDFREGWQRHEWRWEFRELGLRRRRFAQPQWKGEALDGAGILLHAEQGLGDTLQFVRYLPLVAERGGRVVLEVQPRLKCLLQGMAGAACVVARGEVLPEFTWHCPLMSLPLAFGTEIESIPAVVPYIKADADAVTAAWRRYPRDEARLRVGLVWAGNPQYRSDEQRSTTLDALQPLLDVDGVTFFSLQFGPAAAQIRTMQRVHEAGARLIDASSRHKDFAETAALAATLDLVISVDTSVAHLAGAMGLPVWVLLPHLADWRWMDGRGESPWYPTARLFRQAEPGEWGALAERVREELQLWCEGQSKENGADGR